jgi:hypothetical protein
MNYMKTRKKYTVPTTDIVTLVQDCLSLGNPISWNGGHGEDSKDIIEGDPDGDGKGANVVNDIWSQEW